MRGNPHVRFLEGKMAVMSSSYSTCTSVRKACAAARRSSVSLALRVRAARARYREDICEKEGLRRLHRRGQRVCLDRRRTWACWSASARTRASPASYGAHGCPDKGADSACSATPKSKGAWTGAASTSLPEVVGTGAAQGRARGLLCRQRRGRGVEELCGRLCIRSKVAGRGWTSWYRLPFIDYGEKCVHRQFGQ